MPTCVRHLKLIQTNHVTFYVSISPKSVLMENLHENFYTCKVVYHSQTKPLLLYKSWKINDFQPLSVLLLWQLSNQITLQKKCISASRLLDLMATYAIPSLRWDLQGSQHVQCLYGLLIIKGRFRAWLPKKIPGPFGAVDVNAKNSRRAQIGPEKFLTRLKRPFAHIVMTFCPKSWKQKLWSACTCYYICTYMNVLLTN